MKLGLVFGCAGAVLIHVLIILFGGWPFLSDEKDHGTLQQVELLSDAEAPKKEKEKEPATEVKEPIETEAEAPPDASQIMRDLERPAVNDAPALDAASLGAIEAALSGTSGSGGDFAEVLSFNSGGRINGLGKGGLKDEAVDKAFDLSEIDQKPRPIFQASPSYPSEMRGKKVEGVVTLIFVVGAEGKVVNPRVETSNNPAFDRPALEAVRRWKFEPAVKAGQRVSCKMRVPIRFQPNG